VAAVLTRRFLQTLVQRLITVGARLVVLRLALPKNVQTEKSRATGLEQALRQAQAEGL
jgi:hypothetical protein